MSKKTTNLTNRAGETVGTVCFDESAHSWRLASKAEPDFRSWRLASKAEPDFRRRFAREHEAFYFWYSRFDPQNGKLRRWEGSPD